jgi:hypothetical protein
MLFYRVLSLQAPEYKQMMADVHSVLGIWRLVVRSVQLRLHLNSTFNGSTITSAQPGDGLVVFLLQDVHDGGGCGGKLTQFLQEV